MGYLVKVKTKSFLFFESNAFNRSTDKAVAANPQRPSFFEIRAMDLGFRNSCNDKEHRFYSLVIWLAIALQAVFSGCASAPKPVVSTLQITVEAAADVNPDARRRASPVTVRVYALKTLSAFESADFFSLFEKDQATLGAEVVIKEELLLRPGESRVLNMKLGPEAKSLAYFAAFRDLEKATWRGSKTIVAGQVANIKVKVLQKQIIAE
jgi:type VI secretion system protein VasD